MGQCASRAICFLFPTVQLRSRNGMCVSTKELRFVQFNIFQPVFCIPSLAPCTTPNPPSTPYSLSTDPSAGALVIRAAAKVIRSAAENADYELVTRILIACALVAQRSLATSNI